MEFYPLYADYEVGEGKAIIKIVGKDGKGKEIVFEDSNYEPYFYAIPEQDRIEEVIERLKKIEVEHKGEKVRIKRIEVEERIEKGEPVKALKIVCFLPRDIDLLKEEVRNTEGVLHKREYDLPFAKKYCLDKDIRFLCRYEIEDNKLVLKGKETPPLKMAAFDIEIYDSTNLSARDNKIISIAIYGDGIERVLTWQQTKRKGTEVLENEKKMIERFFEIIKGYDIVFSYNGDEFDLKFIKERAKELKVEVPLLSRRDGVRIKGITHIDLLKVVSTHISPELRAPSMKLDDVAMNIIGEGKAEFDVMSTQRLWDSKEDIRDILDYNLQDAKITYLLGKKLLPLEIEFCKLLNLELFEVTRKGFSQLVEWYLMRAAKKKGILIPNRPSNEDIEERIKTSYVGAYVHEPKPGLYENLVNLDFRSLYPSIIVSYNISPDTLIEGDKEIECFEIRINGKVHKFRKDRQGFLSSIVEYLIKKRQEIKKTGGKDAKITEKAIKTLANATYGYLGFFGARWYCKECAESVTAVGRECIKFVIDECERKGFKVVYGDTDGIYIISDKDKAKKLLEEINKKLPGIIELEFKGYFRRGLFIGEKGKGIKKKYALIDEGGNIVIKGFEYVRGDWSKIAKKTQEKVLEYVLKGEVEKALEYVRKTIEKIRKGEISKDDLIIYTKITRDLSKYEQKAPHIAVAMRLKEMGIKIGKGSIISYIITNKGSAINEKARFAEEVGEKDYDPDYYIHHQILPAALRVLKVLGYDEKNIFKEQKSLKSFLK